MDRSCEKIAAGRIGSFGRELLPFQLKPEERILLIWRFEQQLGYKEMLERLGISEDACRKRVLYAVNQCRRFIHN